MEKVEHQPRHGHVGGPRAGVARGAPAGAQLPSEENCVNNLLQSKLFLDTSISPVLASSGCYLGAAGQSSVGLVAVAAMLGKPSAGESPLLCWMYNCPTPPLLLHRSSLQFCPVALLLPAPSSSILEVAANRKLPFIVFFMGICVWVQEDFDVLPAYHCASPKGS